MTENDIAKLNAPLFAHTVAINLIIKSLPDELGVAIAQDVTDEALLKEPRSLSWTWSSRSFRWSRGPG